MNIKNTQEPTSDEKYILTTVDLYTHIYKKIVLFIINKNNFKYDDKTDDINKTCLCINSLSELLNKNKFKSNYIECIYIFISLLKDKEIDISYFFELVEEFIKKINSKQKVDEKSIKNKIYDSQVNTFIDNNELNKVIDWILSE